MVKLKVIIFALFVTNVLTTPIKTKHHLKFSVPAEWNLVPDSEGRLRLMHEQEIIPIAPAFTAESEIVFHLFTRSNPVEAQQFKLGDSFDNLNYNSRHPTRFTIHGFQASITSNLNVEVIPAGLAVGEFNYIGVDWSAGASTYDYISARNRVPEVATVIAALIQQMIEKKLLKIENVALIGHSLGAHIAGLTGKFFNGTIPMIVGLDPASPLFSKDSPLERINATDAKYVEIIHTNGGIFGYYDPLGDADFYPNGGGVFQPGCNYDFLGICSHKRASFIYAESLISPDGFWAIECGSTKDIEKKQCSDSETKAMMGGEPSRKTPVKGIYYLTTGSESPYALGAQVNYL